jgi:hypothetical protein
MAQSTNLRKAQFKWLEGAASPAVSARMSRKGQLNGKTLPEWGFWFVGQET